eukprot:5764275-Amphidinium_carterae.1
MVLFAAMVINIGRRGPDGQTAWELRYGRNCDRQMAEFSEQVLWRDDSKKRQMAEFSEQVLWRDDSKKSKLEDRWHKGVYL